MTRHMDTVCRCVQNRFEHFDIDVFDVVRLNRLQSQLTQKAQAQEKRSTVRIENCCCVAGIEL